MQSHRTARSRRRGRTGLGTAGGPRSHRGVPARLPQRHDRRQGHRARGVLRRTRPGHAALRLFRPRRERRPVRGRHHRPLDRRCARRDRPADRGTAGAGRLLDGRLDRAARRACPSRSRRRADRYRRRARLHRGADVAGDDRRATRHAHARRRPARAEPVRRALSDHPRADRGWPHPAAAECTDRARLSGAAAARPG